MAVSHYGCAIDRTQDPNTAPDLTQPTHDEPHFWDIWKFVFAEEPGGFIANVLDDVTGLSLELYGTRASPTSAWHPRTGKDANGQIFYFNSGQSSSFDVALPPGQTVVPTIAPGYGINMSKVLYDGNPPFVFTGRTAAQWITFSGIEDVDPEDLEDPNFVVERKIDLTKLDTSAMTIDVVVPWRSDWAWPNPTAYNIQYQYAELAGTGGAPAFQFIRLKGSLTEAAKILNHMGKKSLGITDSGIEWRADFDTENSYIRIYADDVLVSSVSCTF